MTETLRIRPVRSKASLKVRLPSVKKDALRAHSSESNLAPVRHARFIQPNVDSLQAVIRLASSGTSRVRSSASVRVQVSAATMAPAEVPVITRGRRFSSRRARTTPKLRQHK